MRKVVIALFGASLVACVPTTPPRPPASTTTAAPATTAAPTTTAAPGPHVPVISAFSASTTAAPSPLTTALAWTISDPDGDVLTCRLDLDGNATYDLTITNCTSATSRTRTFTTPGTTSVGLEVSDGTNVNTASLALNVAAPSSDQYSVTLRFGGTLTSGQTAAFTAAATKWAGIIKTGQPDRTTSFAANSCASGTSSFSGTIDDLMIDAQIIPIDGAGGILGQAGPCLIRSSNGIPLYGVMQFDSADVASLESSGQLANTIVHEMGHILGIGTIWSSSLLLDPGTSNPTFAGPAAVGSWRELGGTGNVPVENSGGSGTADAHWRETTFRTELMTGYLSATNQLSAMTAASLADLGYGVDLAGADAYTLPSAFKASIFSHEAHDHEDMVTILPIASV